MPLSARNSASCPRCSRLLLVALAGAASVGGCSVIGPSARQTPHLMVTAAMRHPEGVPEDGYRDCPGIIHIHTKYSDGAGTFEHIARVANALKLDYLIVTDHNTLAPLRDGKQGWYGMTLVLVGTEISTRAGHYLALNVRDEIHRNQPTQAIIDEVNRQGGLGFIAHPYFKKRRWTDWTVTGMTGIEGYNTAHDTFDENRMRLVLWGVAAPPDWFYLSIIDRPYDPLSRWDRLIAERGPTVGIGSADAHEIRIAGLKIAPYEIMFKLVRTHLLIPEATPLSPEAVYDALRRGHAYFSIDLVSDADGFQFLAQQGDRLLGITGDRVPLVAGLQLTTVLPAPARLTLLRNGVEAGHTTAAVWQVPITEPGAYRVEALRHGKPWIFSNPIYVENPVVGSPSH